MGGGSNTAKYCLLSPHVQPGKKNLRRFMLSSFCLEEVQSCFFSNLVDGCLWAVWSFTVCGCACAARVIAMIIYVVDHYCVSVPLSRNSQQEDSAAGMMKTASCDEDVENKEGK